MVRKPLRIIKAERGRIVNIRDLWAAREVVFFLVWRDCKVRYRQTYLGILWAVLNPIISTGVFTLVFGKLVGVSSQGVPYPLFVLCGLVPWNFFSRAVTTMTGSLVGNQEIVTRIYFPRLAIPIAAMLSCLVDMIPGLAIVFVVSAAYAAMPPVQVFLLPAFIALMVLATLGIGVTLAALNVFYRDVAYMVPFALQVLLFLTPVIYPSSLMPDAWRVLYSLNPMVGIVESIRWCITGAPVEWWIVAVSCLSAAVLLFWGSTYFARAQRTFADVI